MAADIKTPIGNDKTAPSDSCLAHRDQPRRCCRTTWMTTGLKTCLGRPKLAPPTSALSSVSRRGGPGSWWLT